MGPDVDSNCVGCVGCIDWNLEGLLDIDYDCGCVSLTVGSTFITTGSSSHVSTITTVSSISPSERVFRPSHLLQQLQDLSSFVWLSLRGNCTSNGQPDVWFVLKWKSTSSLIWLRSRDLVYHLFPRFDLIRSFIFGGLKPVPGRVGRLFPYNIRGTSRPYADQAFSCESGVVNISAVYEIEGSSVGVLERARRCYVRHCLSRRSS